jgi:integrase
MTVRHALMGGKVQIYRRAEGGQWQCSASVGGRQFRASTKQEGLAQAKDFAEDWFLTLKGKERFGGGVPKGKTFREAADQFTMEYGVITQGERNAKYVDQKGIELRVHLLPFFGDKVVSEITPGTVQAYRVHRATSRKRKLKDGTEQIMRPARSTMHHEIVTLRQVLKTANRHGWLDYVPDMSAPYKSSGKIVHRAWFSPEEYQTLYRATRQRAKTPPHGKWRWECEQLHDYVLMMANTGLRPDEAARLEFRDVVIVDDDSTGERILEIEVRGKRGVGFCKSMPGAVRPFERLRSRLRTSPEPGQKTFVPKKGFSRGGGSDTVKPKPSDVVFGRPQRGLMNAVLDDLDLKIDRDDQRRTSYSLRHTYICMRLMEGADIYQVAKNCRTSVEMIEKFYASHIKNTLDASAINIRKTKVKAAPPLGILTEEKD